MGENILKEMREREGHTVRDLATMASTSASFVNRLERSEFANPPAFIIVQYARIFHMDYNEIMEAMGWTLSKGDKNG